MALKTQEREIIIFLFTFTLLKWAELSGISFLLS